MINIRKSFTQKLVLGTLVLAMIIFTASLGILFYQSRRLIRVEALNRSSSVLNTTLQRLSRNLQTIETATNTCSWMIEQSFEADSLLELTSRIVRLNSNIDGCSVSAEAYTFPEHGRLFSAYTIRKGDSIISDIERPYDYFHKTWYQTPREKDEACWVVYFDDADSLNVVLEGMLASYCKPLRRQDGSVLGIISTDLSLLRLSGIISEVKPYPHSYFVMLDEEGRYMIHPDKSKLFYTSIFTGTDPRHQRDIIALGHEMIAGNKGNLAVKIDDKDCLVCYQPVPGTEWSLALICPDSDVLAGYHRLTFVIGPLLVFGLIVILVLCNRTVTHAIRPINDLLEKTQAIAAGNMEIHIPKSRQEDVIGSLQNSFASMLNSLNFHVGSVRYTSEQTKLRNEELVRATRLVENADKQKTAFIQNLSHQIRTPLNILMGFAQILREAESPSNDKFIRESLTEEEKKSITDMMSRNAKHLRRMLLMLFDSSEIGLNEELKNLQLDKLSCNEVAQMAIYEVKRYFPDLNVNFKSNVPDDFAIHTCRIYLKRSLREILYNAATYSDGQHVSMYVEQKGDSICFIVEDKGKGITESDREDIFRFFTKVDDLSEGLGLGLPLSKRHAQTLGGNLTLDADYHEGCRFILELPLTKQH
jgi:signal transduction histidine kinase